MCKVSNKLKLCSCTIEDFQTLKHYWILYRGNIDSVALIGEMMPPADIGQEAENFNLKTIRKLLNEGNCFDVEMLHREDDILQLYFSYKQIPGLYGRDYLAYAFVYKNGKWQKDYYCTFYSNLDNLQRGEIVNPFLKESNQ